jgi:hypothetical protein
MQKYLFLLFLLSILAFISCSSDTAGGSCETDEQCPSGQYCGEDKVCHKGTKPIKDAGLDAGRDAGLDGGKDAGKDAGKDTGYDIESDILDAISDIPDTQIEDIIEDIEDAGEDAITDISTDIGEDIADIGSDTSMGVRLPSVYDMAGGETKVENMRVKSVTGTSAAPVIDVNGKKVHRSKLYKK